MSDPISTLQAAPVSAQRALTPPAGGKTHTEALTAAKEFESVFLTEMLGSMFEGISTDGPFGGGQGEGMMRSMLVEQYAHSISDRGGIGIADHVFRQLVDIQEKANAGASSP